MTLGFRANIWPYADVYKLSTTNLGDGEVGARYGANSRCWAQEIEVEVLPWEVSQL